MHEALVVLELEVLLTSELAGQFQGTKPTHKWNASACQPAVVQTTKALQR